MQKMPTINEYLNEQKKARNSIETLKRRIRQAYDQAQEKTNDGVYDCLDNLTEKLQRDNFAGTLINHLLAPLQASIAALPEGDLAARALLMHGFYGFTETHLKQFIEDTKENLSFDRYWEYLFNPEKTQLENAINIRLQAPPSILDKIPPEEILSYVKIAAKNPAKLTLKDKTELISAYRQLGVIPPKLLEGKAYM